MMKSQNEILPLISPKGGLKMQPGKDKFKYPAIADYNAFQIKNLNRYIRNNDVSQILKDVRTPIATPQQQRDSEDILKDELREASSNLVYLRKKHDEIKENSMKKEQEINKLRNEIDNYKAKEGFMSEDAFNATHKLTQLKDALGIQKLKIEEAHENQRVYSHMLDRLKKDKVSDLIKSYNFENLLGVKSHVLNAETENAKKARQFEIMTRNVFEGVMKQLEIEDSKRQKSLYIFEKTLTAQEEADQKRTERLQRSKDVAENALTELKDSNETQWRDVQLVHKFLNFFLKRKIEREIRQYEAVEKAYQKIKASTGLSDTREIVSKFVNREQTYSELLISIADYEKKIAELRKINEQHKATIQGLKEQNQPSEKNRDDKVVSKSSLEEIYKDLDTMNESCKQTKLVIEKSYSWVMQSLIKLDKAKKVVNNKYYETYPKDNFAGAVLGLIGVIKTNLEEIKDQDVEKVLDEIDKTKLDDEMKNEEFVAKNVRVKPIHLRAEKLATNESPLTSKRSVHLEETGPMETAPDTEPSDDQDTIEAQRLSVKASVIEEAIKLKKLQEKREKEEIGR